MTSVTTIGDRITLKKDEIECSGLVKFIGELNGSRSDGIYYGCELDREDQGDHNGVFQGINYFTTTQNKGIFIKQSAIIATTTDNHNAPRVAIGDNVYVIKYNCLGIIRFIGETDLDEGIWYGVQLEKQKGENNGSIKDKTYFKCADGYGAFVKADGFSIIASVSTHNAEEFDIDEHKSVEADTDERGYNTAFNISGNEMVTICIGHCGTSIGDRFISTLMNEHEIDRNGEFVGTNHQLLQRINTFFECKASNKETYHSRSVFIDLDKEHMDHMQQLQSYECIGSLSSVKTTKCWAQGYYTDGVAMMDETIKCITSKLERCDTPQGFNFIHSINGGTGGGFGSLLMRKLRDEFPDLISAAYCVYPSMDILDTYNALLSLHSMEDTNDIMVVFDNTSLDKICRKRLRASNPGLNDYNELIATVLSGITSSFRFRCEPEGSSNLQTLYETNAIFPGNVHLSVSHSPYFEHKHDNDTVITAASIYSQLFSLTNNVSNIDICNGKILNYSCIYQCNAPDTLQQIDQYLGNKFLHSLWEYKTKRNPFPFQRSSIYNQCRYHNQFTPIIATSVIHSTAVKSVYQCIQQNADKYLKQKEMISLYCNQGMDANQFAEAQQTINDLIQKYERFEKEEDDDEDTDEDDDDTGVDDSDNDEV